MVNLLVPTPTSMLAAERSVTSGMVDVLAAAPGRRSLAAGPGILDRALHRLNKSKREERHKRPQTYRRGDLFAAVARDETRPSRIGEVTTDDQHLLDREVHSDREPYGKEHNR